MAKKVNDTLNLTAKTIAQEMVENKATVEEAMAKLGMDPKKPLTRLTRNGILEVLSDTVAKGGGFTGEQTAEAVRAVRMISMADKLSRGDMEGALWVADKIATDPATGLTKANGAEVTVNIVESLQGLMDKDVVEIFKIEEKENDDGK
jgi:hypothetical protein